MKRNAKRIVNRWTHAALLAGSLVVGMMAGPQMANAQSEPYPSRPIKVIVAYAAGGPVDVLARRVATELQGRLGRQQIIIDNKPGAGGLIGLESLARAEPDGYTLSVVANPAQTISPHLATDRKFDPLTGFTPIGNIVTAPLGLLIRNDLPIQTVSDLIKAAKAAPGKLTFASAGQGSLQHLLAELLKHTTQINMLHVPYKGGGPALTDLLAGHVDLLFMPPADSVGPMKTGKVRMLAMGSRTRNRMVPNIPTFIEAGIDNFESLSWYALEGPPRLPAALVNQLHGALTQVIQDPAFANGMQEAGYDLALSSPAELGARVRTEYARWEGILKALKMTP